jgi:putative transposase
MLHTSQPPSQPSWRGGRTTPRGRVHLVEFGTVDLRPVFADFATAALAARDLFAAQRAGKSTLLAWALLPDRWAGLIEVAPDDNLSRCVARYKLAMARALREADPARERIWALDFFDRPLLHDRDVLDCAGRLVMHPIRAGLVHRLTDYPFWDAVWLPSLSPPPPHAVSGSSPAASPPAPPGRSQAAAVPALVAHPALCF